MIWGLMMIVCVMIWLIYVNSVVNSCRIDNKMSMGILRDIGLKVEGDVAGKIEFFWSCRSVNQLTYSVNRLTHVKMTKNALFGRVNRLTLYVNRLTECEWEKIWKTENVVTWVS